MAMRIRQWRWILVWLMTGIMQLGSGINIQVSGQVFEITRIAVTPGGAVELEFPAESRSYYILYEGEDVTSIDIPTGMVEGQDALLNVTSGRPQTDSRFYRLTRLPEEFPRDSDGDGIDDLYELRRPSILNPFDPSDALLDSDTDGRSNLREYERGTNPVVIDSELTTLVATSPFDGEGAVAVTRETILQFSAPLAGNVLDIPGAIVASFAGQPVTSRMELSPDRRKVTLFYPQRLPGSSRVRVVIDGDKILDSAGNRLDVDEDLVPGGIGSFDFDTVHIRPRANTAIIGRVFASELSGEGENLNTPLAGAKITVDGQESEIQAVTDAQGNFRLDNAPSGDFFIHIDGRLVEDSADNLRYPDLDYYPFVGKKWTGVPGEVTNVGNIFLPRIRQGTLKEVKADTETVVTVPDPVVQEFPELEGVALVVPPNALFSDDGTRGGMVGIAPVDPDRLPGQLPPGLEFPLVITVQTDGATNFDTPVSVCFPNLPDPLTGEILPPGAKSALWSFNHDTGQFEVIGPMTVSADGKLICTDEGVGIEAPGWHGSRRGGQMKHKREKCPSFGWSDAWKIAKQAFDCAKNVLGIGSGIKAAVQAADGIRDFYEFVGTVREKYNKGESLGGDIIGQLNSQKQRVAGVVEEFTNVGSPINKTLEGVKCITGLASLGVDILCKGSKCKGSIARIICSIAQPLFRVANDVANKADDIAKGFKNAPIKAACFAVDQLIKGFTGQSINPGGGQTTPVRLANHEFEPDPQILELFDEIINKSKEEEANFRQFAALETEINIIADELDKLQFDGFIQFAVALGGLSNAPYKLTIDGDRVTRGTLSASGQILVSVAPNAPYRFEAVVPSENILVIAVGTTPPNGMEGEFGPFSMIDLAAEPDGDNDLLADRAEDVLGSDPADPDTDKDGILDGTEVFQGTDPLGDTRLPVGILGSVNTPGNALDICAANNLALVADSSEGILIYNIFDSLAPLQISQVQTAGSAQALHCSGNLVAVADGSRGLTIVDITDPVVAQVIHEVPVGHATSVTTAGDLIAFAGLRSGEVVAVDMLSGVQLGKSKVSELAIQDLFLAGDHLYVLDAGNLHVTQFVNGLFRVSGSVTSPGGVNTAVGRNRLFVGGDVAYATHRRGYNTIDVSNPLEPSLIAHRNSGQFGWKHIVLNGSGLGIAAVSPNQSFDGPHHISIYNTSDPNNVDDFQFEIVTPGVARSVSLLNGLAYVADHTSGFHIINYSEADRNGVSPSIALTSNLTLNKAEENKPIRLTAEVSDDVQVRQVEFFLNGERIAVDGNYPFEHRFLAPSIAVFGTFDLFARVTDTGGNSTLSESLIVELVPDATPPMVTRRVPDQGSGSDALLSEIIVYLDEQIDPASLNDESLKIFGPGADGVLGTEDDVLISGGVSEYNSETLAVVFSLEAPLPAGIFRVVVSGAITDLRGNPIGDPVEWTVSSGQGITGMYYEGIAFNNFIFERVDASIDFDHGTGSPDDRLPPDFFSIRWMGAIVPEFTETYTFYTHSDDGVRLWINDELIIENWTVHAVTENSGTMDLEAGKRYDIKLEFYENAGFAVARLLWSSPSVEKQVIAPAHYLPFGILPPKAVEAISVNRVDEIGIVMNKAMNPETLVPANFQLSNGLAVDAVSQGSLPTHIVLHVSGLEPYLNDLSITLSRLRGAGAGAEIMPEPQTIPVFTGHGRISQKVWRGIPTGALTSLIDHPGFPGIPDEIHYLDAYEIPPNTADNFGVLIQGYLFPPESGDYVFHISSDDQSQLFLGASPDSFTLLAQETAWSGFRDYNRSPSTVSEPVTLDSGQRYYTETIMKEGPGGDNLSVAWVLPGGDPILDGDPPIPGEVLAAFASSGTPSLSQGPQSVTINEFENAEFHIDGYQGSTPYFIEWLLNGEPILNESSISLILEDTSAGLNGAELSARVTNPFGSFTTEPATLNVIPDLAPPGIDFISSSVNGSVHSIHFSERVNRAQATNPDNYAVPGVIVRSVALNGAGDVVTLRTDPLTSGQVFPLRVSGIADVAFNANLIEPAPYQLQSWVTLPKGGLTRLYYPGKGNVAQRDALYPLPRGMGNYPSDFTMDNVSVVDSFETPVNVANNYMVILTGYICPPQTADYTFHMASDDTGELFLSTDSDPSNSRLIASEPRWNGSRVWTGFNNRNPEAPENISDPITLEKDQLYYVEAVMQEGSGGDNLGVTWRTPDDPEVTNGQPPISGEFLRAIIPPPVTSTVFIIEPGDEAVDVSESSGVTINLIEGSLPVDTGSIRIVLNQKPYIPGIERAGGNLTLTLPAGSLDGGTHYRASLIWKEVSRPDAKQFNWSFHTTMFPSGARFLEAEDFNFEEGSRIAGANGGPSGAPYTGGAYRDKIAVSDIDFHDFSGGGSAYRTKEKIVGIGVRNNDFSRGAFDVEEDHVLGWNHNGEWRNYTREFPASPVRYLVNARVGSRDERINIELARVTSSSSVPDQTTELLGAFRGDPTGNFSTHKFDPLVDELGNPVPVTLSGINTLRLTTGPGSRDDRDNHDLNYLVFTPTREDRPNFFNVFPDRFTAYDSSSSELSFTLRENGAGVVTDSIRVMVHGLQVPILPPVREGNQISVSAAGLVDIGYGEKARIDVLYSMVDGRELSSGWHVTTSIPIPQGARFIEAEDFNYSDESGAGKWIPDSNGGPSGQPYSGAEYRDLGATEGIDYHEVTGAGNRIYRAVGDLRVGMVTDGFRTRGEFTIESNHIVGWVEPDEWWNYTRSFPDSPVTYEVFARLSSGAADPHAFLESVGTDPTKPNQVTSVLGQISDRATGSYGLYTLYKLRQQDGSAAPLRLTLSGLQTLRLRNGNGNMNVDYLVFLPVP